MNKKATRTLWASAFILALGACDMNDGPAEEAGEKIDDAYEGAVDNVEDTADDIGDAAEDAGDKIEDKLDQMK